MEHQDTALHSVEKDGKMKPSAAMSNSPPVEGHPGGPQSPARRQLLKKETFHKPEDWDSLRDVIRQLYIEENKTLAKVSDILETQYSFIARSVPFLERALPVFTSLTLATILWTHMSVVGCRG